MSETVLITGASSGIGRELARLFARDGYSLVLTGRSQERLAALAEELRAWHNTPVEILACDLGQPGAAEQIAAFLAQKQIAVDILVNNAGTQVYGEFAAADPVKTLEMIQINVTALSAAHRTPPASGDDFPRAWQNPQCRLDRFVRPGTVQRRLLRD